MRMLRWIVFITIVGVENKGIRFKKAFIKNLLFN